MIILGYVVQIWVDWQYENFQCFFNNFIDFLWGIDILKYFGLFKCYFNLIFKLSEFFCKLIMDVLKVVMLLIFVFDFFIILLIVIVVVYLGFGLIDVEILFFLVLVILILVLDYFLLICNFVNDYYVILDGKNFF